MSHVGHYFFSCSRVEKRMSSASKRSGMSPVGPLRFLARCRLTSPAGPRPRRSSRNGKEGLSCPRPARWSRTPANRTCGESRLLSRRASPVPGSAEEIMPFCFFYSNVSFPGVSTIFYILLDRNQHGGGHSTNKQIFTKFDM